MLLTDLAAIVLTTYVVQHVCLEFDQYLVCVQITTVDEAKTFYPLFGLGANVALIFSGRAVKYFSQVVFASVLAEDCVCGHCLFH